MPKMRLGYCRPGASPLKRMTASWCGSLADPPSKPGEFHPELLTGRVENWRAGLANTFRPRHVSSSLHVARSVQISRTARPHLLHAKAYGTYPAEATFGLPCVTR